MSNPFALLDIENDKKNVSASKASVAPKKDAKAIAQHVAPKGDRHTKFGRDAGEANTKRPHDRSLNRQRDKKVERKGEQSGVKGSWGNKDPHADQVPADPDQKRDDAFAKAEFAAKAEARNRAEKKPEEPPPFLFLDALKARQTVVGEKHKIRAADCSVAETAVLKQGAKPDSHVAFIHKSKSEVNANKKQLSLDEFFLVSGGQGKVEHDQLPRTHKKAPHFPAL
jgi:hypothetical protein